MGNGAKLDRCAHAFADVRLSVVHTTVLAAQRLWLMFMLHSAAYRVQQHVKA